MGNSLSEAHGGNQFCIFGKVNERKQRKCGSGCANDRARAEIVLSNCDNTNSECRTKHGHCIHSDAENAEKQRNNCRNDPLGRTGGIAEYAEYDADKYKHDSDYLALGIGRIGGFAALLFPFREAEAGRCSLRPAEPRPERLFAPFEPVAAIYLNPFRVICAFECLRFEPVFYYNAFRRRIKEPFS